MGAGNGGRRKKGGEKRSKVKYCPGLSGQGPAVGSQQGKSKEKKKKSNIWEKFKLLIIALKWKGTHGESPGWVTSRGIGNHFTFFVRKGFDSIFFYRDYTGSNETERTLFCEEEQDVRH